MSRIFVRVKPSAKRDEVLRTDETHFTVRVKAKPQDGRANEAVLETLAAYLKVPKSRLSLISGAASRSKVIQLR